MQDKGSSPTTIDEYVSQFPGDVQAMLSQIRAVIKEAAPGATEKISYGMPTFYLRGNLVHFAAAQRHIGFYPTPSGIEAFKDEFARRKYKWSKGAVQFPLDQPVPHELIAEIVKFRVAESGRK